MSEILKYSAPESALAIDGAMLSIQRRYDELRKKMLQESTLQRLHNDKIKKIKSFLTTLNSTYANLSSEQIEQKLRDTVTNYAMQETNNILQQIATSSSQITQSAMQKQSLLKTQNAKSNSLRAIGQLYDLYAQMRGKTSVSVDAETFIGECNRVLNSLAAGGITSTPLNSNSKGFKETGNYLGHIGAIAGAELAQNVISDLIGQTKTSKAIVYDTGHARTIVPAGQRSQTVTTDTLVASYRVSGTTAELQATLNISDKFNAKYTKNSNSTGRPVKLATRTVNSFLREVRSGNLREDYEIALMNYLSYHVYKDDAIGFFRRVSFLPDSTFTTDSNGTSWGLLRRAIGAELMFSELFGTGKGQFMIGNMTVDDKVDLYLYGDKIFLADDILRSRQSTQHFNMAQISTEKRKKLLTSSNIQSMPTKPVLIGGEEEVIKILSTSIITYSQTVKF